MSVRPHIAIFTDGACRGNPGPGGWGALLRYGEYEKTLSGAESYTTNNRMELVAVIQALNQVNKPCKIDVTTDSEYVRQGITTWLANWKKKGWKTKAGEPVKNQDLWQQLDTLTQPHEIHWHWVKGHNGHAENEQVDALARAAIDKLLRGD